MTEEAEAEGQRSVQVSSDWLSVTPAQKKKKMKENSISYLGHQPFPKRPTHPLNSNLRVKVSKLKNTLKTASVRGGAVKLSS